MKTQSKKHFGYVGVDLGGTNVRAGLIVNKKIIFLEKNKINGQGTQKEVFQNLCLVLDPVLNLARTQSISIKGIGLGVPSVVDPHTGVIHNTTNIPSWKNFPLRLKLEKKYHLPIRINNDANCFALGEHRYGGGQGSQNMVGLILGTGLGAGIISNGQLHSGWHCAAGEFGIIPYLDGITENYASGQFFKSIGYDGETLSKLAKNGDTEALNLFSVYGTHVGKAIKVILYALAPEQIILGGSVSQALPFFKGALKKELDSFVYPHLLKKLKIKKSNLKYSAILGAASLCMNQ